MIKYKTLDEFFAGQPKEILDQINLVRNIILGCEPTLQETIKWNAPNYVYNDEDRITFNVMNKQNKVKLLIHMGATMKEHKGGKPILVEDEGIVEWNSDIRGTIGFDDLSDIKHKRLLGALLALAVILSGALGACSDDADVASENVSKASDNFEINRRIVFFNGITDQYMFTIEGRCSIEVDNEDSQLEVICKLEGKNKFKKHFLGLSDNVTYFVEQLDPATVDPYHYRVTFKPETIVPDVDTRTSGDEGDEEGGG